jgi:hypothetical protein
VYDLMRSVDGENANRMVPREALHHVITSRLCIGVAPQPRSRVLARILAPAVKPLLLLVLRRYVFRRPPSQSPIRNPKFRPSIPKSWPRAHFVSEVQTCVWLTAKS